MLLTLSIILFFYIFFNSDLLASLIILLIIIVYQIFSLIRYIDLTNKELTRFLQSIKYSDFSQTFSKTQLGSTYKELNSAFNEVMNEFLKTRSEKEENYRFVQTVMQHIGIGLLSFNQEGKIEFINNAAKKIFRVNYLTNINGLNKIEEGVSEKLQSIKPGEKGTIKLSWENEVQQLVVYPAEFKLRNQKFTLLSLQNILPELEEKEMEAWQKLIRVLTHEIMNSITPISSLASTVKGIITGGNLNEQETKEDMKLAIDTIQKRSDGLIHFVDNYRSLTTIPKPNFKIFPVKELFHRINKLMEPEISRKNISFFVQISPESLELTADPDLVEQVLINLLVNSIHSVLETDNPRIKLIASFDNLGKIVIKVIDNGSGINEDMQEKIFIPFFSTKKNGSGIGLSLSRQVMRSHGGTIRVSSKPNIETVFTLSF